MAAVAPKYCDCYFVTTSTLEIILSRYKTTRNDFVNIARARLSYLQKKKKYDDAFAVQIGIQASKSGQRRLSNLTSLIKRVHQHVHIKQKKKRMMAEYSHQALKLSQRVVKSRRSQQSKQNKGPAISNDVDRKEKPHSNSTASAAGSKPDNALKPIAALKKTTIETGDQLIARMNSIEISLQTLTQEQSHMKVAQEQLNTSLRLLLSKHSFQASTVNGTTDIRVERSQRPEANTIIDIDSDAELQ